jgi:fibronectin-binding autotransporter adhesin
MRKAKLYLSALLLSMSSVFMFAVPKALAATRTWDGGGGDNNMMTAANWTGDVAPSAGDDLVFPANVTDRTVVNDFTAATSFNSITFSGATSADSDYSISGNAIELVAGITNSMTGSNAKNQTIELDITLTGVQTFQTSGGAVTVSGDLALGSNNLTVSAASSAFMGITGVVTGSGTLTKTGTGTLNLEGNSSSYTGAITVSAGTLYASQNSLGGTGAGTTVTSGATLGFCFTTDLTSAEPLTVGGSGVSGAALTFDTCVGPGNDKTLTLSGDIVLTANTVVSGTNNMTITGDLSGSYTVSVKTGASGAFIINSSANTSETPNGTLEQTAEEVEIEEGDDQPSTSVTVANNVTYIIDGTRGDTTVSSGGTLKGTGTVGDLSVAEGGIVAPGHSPGCLNSGDLSLDGSYQWELGGTTECTEYDQIVVTGAVGAGGSLDVSLVNDFKPTAGQKFVIISNDASEAVAGTFDDLAQGDTFEVDDYTFSISYTGGDGNDVELTVTAVPPDTGFALLANNPFFTMAVMLGAAAGIALLARRNFRLAFARRRR